MSSLLLDLQNFPSINIQERTELAATANSGQAILQVDNADSFSANDWLVIDAGEETGELRQVQSITLTSITLTANLAFQHLKYARVWKLRGNQLKLYRAPNVDGTIPLDTSFAAYPGTSPANPVSLQADQFTTPVVDPTGGVDYWYKQTFLNSTTLAETDLSLSVAIRGGDYGHYVSLDEIRVEAGFSNNPNVTDAQIAAARDDAEAIINSVISVSGYALPITDEVPTLRTLARWLGAGYLLLQEYGAGAEGTNKDGNEKVTRANAILDAIREGSSVLVNIDGVVLSQSDGPSGIPNDTTVSSLDDPRPPVFTMVDKF